MGDDDAVGKFGKIKKMWAQRKHGIDLSKSTVAQC